MKISKNLLYGSILIILIILQLYVVSYKVSFFLQLLLIAVIVLNEKLIVKKLYLKTIIPLIVLTLLGFIGTIINQYQPTDIIKDFIFFTKPIVGLTIAYLIASAINNVEKFIRIIIYLGLICALIHLFIVVFITNHTSIHAIRDYTKDNFVELFSIYFLLDYRNIFKKNFINNKYISRLILFILIISSFLYFSRMMYVLGGILFLAYFGLTRINKLNISVFIGIIFLIIGLFSILNTMNIRRNGSGLEAFLYKIKISPEEIVKSKVDKNNHKELWDNWRGYEVKRAKALVRSNPGSEIIGNGHGSLINLKMYAPLGGGKKGLKYISHLHNGYGFLYYKLGFVGLIIYIIFLARIYLIGQIKNNKIATIISCIGLIYFFTSLTITGVYNQSENLILILGGLIFYYSPIHISKKEIVNE